MRPKLFGYEFFAKVGTAVAYQLRSHASPCVASASVSLGVVVGAFVDGLVLCAVAVLLWFCVLSLLEIFGFALSSFAAVAPPVASLRVEDEGSTGWRSARGLATP